MVSYFYVRVFDDERRDEKSFRRFAHQLKIGKIEDVSMKPEQTLFFTPEQN